MIKQYQAWSEKVQNFLTSFLLILITAAVFLQVIVRKVIPLPLVGTTEIAKISLIWFTYLGLAATFSQNYHIRIDIIDGFIKTDKQKNILNLIIDFMGVIFGAFISYYSYIYLSQQFAAGQTLNIISIPMWVAILPILLGGIFTTIHFIITFISGIREMRDKG